MFDLPGIPQNDGHVKPGPSQTWVLIDEREDVQRWCDVPSPQDLPGVGEEVSLPVQVTPYVQAGVAKVRYSGRDAQPLGCF